MTPRPSAAALTAFAAAVLERAGMEPAMANAVADVLVEGDLLGHTTHGLQLLPLYLAEIEKKQMTLSGGPEVLADHPAAVTWGRAAPARSLAHAGGDRVGLATTSAASPPISNASPIRA